MDCLNRCFQRKSDQDKERCATFMRCMGCLIFILGVISAAIGFLSTKLEETWKIGDYTIISPSAAFGALVLFGGVMTGLVGFFAFFVTACRSKYYTIPFIILTPTMGLIMLIAGFVAIGVATKKKLVEELYCNQTVDNELIMDHTPITIHGQKFDSLWELEKQYFRDTAQKFMCTAECPCDAQHAQKYQQSDQFIQPGFNYISMLDKDTFAIRDQKKGEETKQASKTKQQGQLTTTQVKSTQNKQEESKNTDQTKAAQSKQEVKKQLNTQVHLHKEAGPMIGQRRVGKPDNSYKDIGNPGIQGNQNKSQQQSQTSQSPTTSIGKKECCSAVTATCESCKRGITKQKLCQLVENNYPGCIVAEKKEIEKNKAAKVKVKEDAKKVRTYGHSWMDTPTQKRIADISTQNWGLDRKEVPLYFTNSLNVKTFNSFHDCYKQQEKDKVLEQKYGKEFKPKVFDEVAALFELLEGNLNSCSGICRKPTFGLSTQISDKPPQQACIEPFTEQFEGLVGPGVLCMLSFVVLMIITFSAVCAYDVLVDKIEVIEPAEDGMFTARPLQKETKETDEDKVEAETKNKPHGNSKDYSRKRISVDGGRPRTPRQANRNHVDESIHMQDETL